MWTAMDTAYLIPWRNGAALIHIPNWAKVGRKGLNSLMANVNHFYIVANVTHNTKQTGLVNECRLSVGSFMPNPSRDNKGLRQVSLLCINIRRLCGNLQYFNWVQGLNVSLFCEINQLHIYQHPSRHLSLFSPLFFVAVIEPVIRAAEYK